MNVNEVISNIASKANGEPLGSHRPVHPNDDVNQSQSTNDTFPAAIHIAATNAIKNKLLPELQLGIDEFNLKSHNWRKIVKIQKSLRNKVFFKKPMVDHGHI